MIALEAFSELLSVLYLAPLQQEQWPRFLALLNKHTRSMDAIFFSSQSSSGSITLTSGGHQELKTAFADYNENFAQNNPLLSAIIRNARIGVFTESDMLPCDGLLETAMYREILHGLNHRYGAIAVLNVSVRRFDILSVWRSPEQGPMTPESRHLLELLVPHLQTALQIVRTLGLAKQRLAGAEAMANASATATFLLSKQGLINHWNVAAESMVRGGDGLTVLNGNLVVSERQSRDALKSLILNAASSSFLPPETQPSCALSLPRPSGKPPLQLLACSLPPAQRHRSNADLLLLVTDPEKPVNFPDEMLRTFYGLTAAEAEVANGLLMGFSAEEIASLRHVSLATVRYQLKSMLSKTGTNRQSDMVRLFMALPRVPAQEN